MIGAGTIADGETASLLFKIEHSDASNMAGAVVVVSETISIVGDDTSQHVSSGLDFDFGSLKRYWRASVTPTMSAADTDSLLFCVAGMYSETAHEPGTIE